MNTEKATGAQIAYILTIARKSNIHDNTLDEIDLKAKIKIREGIDVDELTISGASALIDKYKKKLNYTFQKIRLSRKSY